MLLQDTGQLPRAESPDDLRGLIQLVTLLQFYRFDAAGARELIRRIVLEDFLSHDAVAGRLPQDSNIRRDYELAKKMIDHAQMAFFHENRAGSGTDGRRHSRRLLRLIADPAPEATLTRKCYPPAAVNLLKEQLSGSVEIMVNSLADRAERGDLQSYMHLKHFLTGEGTPEQDKSPHDDDECREHYSDLEIKLAFPRNWALLVSRHEVSPQLGDYLEDAPPINRDTLFIDAIKANNSGDLVKVKQMIAMGLSDPELRAVIGEDMMIRLGERSLELAPTKQPVS
jgi:hypothetical protein